MENCKISNSNFIYINSIGQNDYIIWSINSAKIASQRFTTYNDSCFIDIKGKLYSSIKTYDKLPVDSEGNLLFDGIYCYTDTADEGDDYLCSIVWGTYLKEAYILDLIYIKAQRWLEVILICFCAFLYYLSLKEGSDKKVKIIIYKLNRRRIVWKKYYT